MNEQIRISVIIPVYNSESYLSECMDSILSQSLGEIEIICVDDGSTDASLSMLKNYEKRDARIRIIEQSHKNGAAARNRGLEIAKGEYLAFMDADDYYYADALKIAYSKAEKDSEIDIVVFGANEYNVANKREKFLAESLVRENCPDHVPFSPDEMADKLFNSFHNWPWNKIFRRSFIEKNGILFQEVGRSNDVLFVSLALALAKKITLADQALICHRVGHGANMQALTSEDPLAFWTAFLKTYQELERHGMKEDMKKSFLNGALYAFRNYLDSVRHDDVSYEIVKKHILDNAEKDFAFLSHGKEYYVRKEDYDWYVGLEKEERQKKGSIFDYIAREFLGFFISLKENGIRYTFDRVLFHLGFREDNDPVRTKNSRNR
jgi:glycosyltransferase involved in cell wall biosynthesis